MITSFGNKDTKKIWQGERIKKLSLEILKGNRRTTADTALGEALAAIPVLDRNAA